jgi:hypothetical protein
LDVKTPRPRADILVGDETRDIASSHGLDDHCASQELQE